jgi:hypothetical protein
MVRSFDFPALTVWNVSDSFSLLRRTAPGVSGWKVLGVLADRRRKRP